MTISRNRKALLSIKTLLACMAVFTSIESVADAQKVVNSLSEQILPVSIRSVLKHRNIPVDSLSLYVVDLKNSETLLSWNEGESKIPASTIKILTTLVALEELGPNYKWKTDVHLLGDIDTDKNTLQGDLLLKGYGDPFLVSSRVWQLIHYLRSREIKNIDGNLLLDDSFFKIVDYDPSAFDNEPLRAYNVEPNALMMNFKVINYFFYPDDSSKNVQIYMDPFIKDLQIINRLSTVDGECRGYQRGITISPNEKYNKFIFSGEFPRDCNEYSMSRMALTHNEYTYGLFKSIWEESGGELKGRWKNVKSDIEVEPFLSFESLSLAEVIKSINKFSNNVMAKHLLLTLAAEKFGQPGTENNGRKVIKNWLERKNIDSENLVIDNGSGLSRKARINAKQLVDLLVYAYKSPYMPEFISSLSLSGMDGTMSHRFNNEELTGMVHLKTGRIDHVISMAGYIQSQSGERYAVALIQNYEDIHKGFGEEIQEALLRWISEQ